MSAVVVVLSTLQEDKKVFESMEKTIAEKNTELKKVRRELACLKSGLARKRAVPKPDYFSGGETDLDISLIEV